MTLTDKNLLFLKQNVSKVPLKVLAKKYKMEEIELIKLLRQKGIITEIQPIELQYIKENLDKIPAKAIQKTLGLTNTQFYQLMEKKLNLKSLKSLEDLTLEEVINKTKWLIEEKLELELDDFLPRNITSDHFQDNDLYCCIRYAEHHKKADPYYQYFASIAFLVCKSYPDLYRPFQFRHSKTNDFFRGPAGKKNFLNAVRWVIENKLGLNPEYIEAYKNNRYFLKSSDLQFYGLGHHWYKEHFDSTKN